MTEKKNEIEISASDDVSKGTYANQFMVGHTQTEFLFDFMTIFPPKGVLGARVIMLPLNAKRLLKSLHGNLVKYEEKFGKIKEEKNNGAE